MNTELRQFKTALWSYDVDQLDLDRNRELIITQLLNYSNWEAVRWLYRTYGEAEIRRVVSAPRRGVWFGRVLNFWTLMLGVELAPDVFQRAVWLP